MQNNKLIRIAQAFILFPVISMSGSLGAASTMPQTGASILSTSEFVLSQKFNVGSNGFFSRKEEEKKVDPQALILKMKAEAIDTYFRERSMPLEGMGMKMVIEAEKNGLDWRLIAAIAVRESTGGKFECKRVENNPFGWGSCKIGFESNEKAIETVARNLGGNNPNTAHHYDDKTTIQILRAYNPPSVVPKYAEQVISIMNVIGEDSIALPGENIDKETAS